MGCQATSKSENTTVTSPKHATGKQIEKMPTAQANPELEDVQLGKKAVRPALPPLKDQKGQAVASFQSLKVEEKNASAQNNVQEQMQKQQQHKMVTEHMMFDKLTLSMHGGAEMNAQSQNFISDAQLSIAAAQNVKVKITAQAKNNNVNVLLVAVKNGDFPLQQVGEVIKQQQSNQKVELEITSPGLCGFVVFIASGGQSVDVTVDGQGKPILSMTHVDPLP